MLGAGLKLKSMVIGSPLEPMADRLRWALSTLRRRSHPELTEIYLESRRLPAVLQKLLSSDSSVLDIGCHIGSFLNLAIKIAPKGKHAAIEAMPNKAALLALKFPDVKIKNIAVSDRCGMITFEQNITNPGHSRISDDQNGWGQKNLITLPTATLDSLNMGEFDLIKLDIEGAELAALKGGKQMLMRLRPKLIFENGVIEYGKQNPQPLYDFLTNEMGYHIFTFVDYLHDKGPIGFDEFRKCGLYPFRAFNFIGLPK